MPNEPLCNEPRLQRLFALVGGVLCLTGLCVASYLAADPVAWQVPGCSADCGLELGCEELVPRSLRWRAVDLAEVVPALRCTPAPCGRPS